MDLAEYCRPVVWMVKSLKKEIFLSGISEKEVLEKAIIDYGFNNQDKIVIKVCLQNNVKRNKF